VRFAVTGAHIIALARSGHLPIGRPIRPARKIIGHMIFIRRAKMMRRRAALGQINVVEKSIILKEDINATARTGVPAIAPAAGKSWAMRQNQMPRFMIPAACNAALALELHRSILMVIEDLPSNTPAVTHKIIKAKWQFWQGCSALGCHSLP